MNTKNRNAMKTFITTTAALLIATLTFASHIAIDTLYAREWNARKAKWEDYERTIVIRNNDLKLSEIMQVQCRKAWVNYTFRSYSYDSSGLLQEMVEKSWNGTEEWWEDSYRQEYSYNESGRVSVILHQHIYAGRLVDDTRETLVYDGKGLLITKTVEEFADLWENRMKYDYHYNTEGLLRIETLSHWNGSGWDAPATETRYTYNDLDQLTARIKGRNTPSGFVYVTKETYACNGEGFVCQQISYRWDEAAARWQQLEKTDYVNGDGPKKGEVTAISQRWEEPAGWAYYLLNEMPCCTGEEDLLTEAAQVSFVVVPSLFRNSITLEFTNPSNDTYQVYIINRSGEIVKSDVIPENRITLARRELAQGEYYVELKGEKWYSGMFTW